MVYTIMADTKKPLNERMTEAEMSKMLSDDTKGITLWAYNNVVKKWLKYRKASIEQANPETLLLLEDIIYEIRKDVCQRKKLGKGDMLSFFINYIEKLFGKK